MKSIFTLVFGFFMAISASFSQSDSLLASVDIVSAPEVEMEKDTTFVVSKCDSLGEMSFSEFIETDCALLPLIESELSPISIIDESTLLPVIHKITYTDRFDFSVSDVDRTPDSVKEFVESVNDSTIFLAEANDGKFFSVNSLEDLDQYEKIIVADTIKVNDKLFIFDSTQVASIKEFVNANYVLAETDTLSSMMNLVSGYTEDEELAMFARWEEETVQNESVSAVDENSIIYVDQKNASEVFYVNNMPIPPSSKFQFVSNPSDFGSTTNKNKIVGGNKYSSHQTKILLFGMICVAFLLAYPIVYHLRKVKKNLSNMTISEKKAIVKIEPKTFRFLRKFFPSRKKSYMTEPAEEGARAPSS